MRLAQLNCIGMSAEYLGQVVAMRVEASLVSIPVHLDRGSVCWAERWGRWDTCDRCDICDQCDGCYGCDVCDKSAKCDSFNSFNSFDSFDRGTWYLTPSGPM